MAKLKTNEARLARFRLQGSIVPPSGYGWEISHDEKNRVLPSVGGITLNFKVGDLADQFVADHLEPAVTTSMETDGGKAKSTRNTGYNTFSCIGNEAVVIGGRAKGRKGTVTGHHGGVQHVIIDFDDDTLEKLTYDDRIMITAFGSGLEIGGFEDIRCFALDPALLARMNATATDGKLRLPVAAIVPAVVMGSGLGGSTPFMGDYDIQTSDPETNEKYGLNQLRLGDIVALMDQDASQGYSYRQGAISIAVIIHGDSKLAGHGPGCQVIMSSKSGRIVPTLDPKANVGRYLKIGRFRKRK